MRHDFNFGDILTSSQRGAWQIEDVLPAGAKLDFSRPFLPGMLARTRSVPFLGEDEARILNQIRGHEYLGLFGLVEEFILPFVLDHARPQLNGDDERVRALLNFASEEAKHIHLFRQFKELFASSFGTPCALIGPPEAVAAEVLRHDPLAVALVILMIEWMTQSHYVDSVRDDVELDPLFKSLLKHHWIEEAQHAKLDTLMVQALAEGRSEAGIDRAIDEFLQIGTFLDAGLEDQTRLNLEAFEAASGRRLSGRERAALTSQQHQALRWTYLGSGMIHPRFVETLAAISPAARDRIAAVAPAFA
ncbi:MAG TPA: hypothetical protein VFO69_05735 [Allosphingosinicella sp.]|nr:hypothetical protein [Allosphingosinicella sp.]